MTTSSARAVHRRPGPPARLLDADEEIELARRIEAGTLAAAILGGHWPDPPGPFDPTELTALVRIGRLAFGRYVEANLALVGLVLAESGRRGEPDLFQEGCLGLLEAVRRFDHRRGFRFATYALHWIRSAVRAAAGRRDDTPGLSGAQAARLRQVRGVHTRLTQELGREPTVEQLAVAVGRSVGWTRQVLDHRAPTPVDLSVVQLADHRADRAFELTLAGGMPGAELLDRLPSATARVLRLRYGFTDDRAGHTVARTAELLGLTTGQVRRLERDGLELLREHCPAQARDHLAG